MYHLYVCGTGASGGTSGTGGSSGVAFLKQALELTFFPELFEVRTALDEPAR